MDAAVNAMMQVIAIIFWGFVGVMLINIAYDAVKALKNRFIKYIDKRNSKKYAKWKSEKW
mgnify:CR=1 FL=1